MPITFPDIAKVANGAHFYNADLHVHSYGASHDVKDASMTVEAIIDEAVDQRIAVVVITGESPIAGPRQPRRLRHPAFGPKRR